MAGKKWTTEEDSLLTKLVDGSKSYKEIAEYFPERTPYSLQIRAVRVLNLDNTGYFGKGSIIHSHNKSFWSTPNLLNSYWAGFIAADGSLRNPAGESYIFSLMLAKVDKYHIQKFADTIQYTGTVKDYKDTSYVSMTCGTQWFEDLERNFNIVPNKTKNLQPPSLSLDLSWAYLLGYLDGDGCIHCHKNGTLNISFTSCSRDILTWVKNMTDHLTGERKTTRNIHEYSNFNRFALHGEAAAKLYIFLFKINVPKLDRKWNNEKIWSCIKTNYSHLL
jgi:hypothetical protein